MKKRVLQWIVIILVILGYNLLCQGEVLADTDIEIKKGVQTIYVNGDIRDTEDNVSYTGPRAAVINITGINAPQNANTGELEVKFETYAENAMSMYYGYQNPKEGWEVQNNPMRVPADRHEKAGELQKNIEKVQYLLNQTYDGEIDKNGQNGSFYDSSKRAVFPGKTYDYDLNLSGIEMGNEYSVKVEAGGDELEIDSETGKYKLKVPKTSGDDNYFKSNKFRVKVTGHYHTYKAIWTVRVKFKKDNGKYYITEKDTEGRAQTRTENGNKYIYIQDIYNDKNEGVLGNQIWTGNGEGTYSKKRKFHCHKAEKIRVPDTGKIKKELKPFNLLADVTINQWIQNVSLQTRDEFKTIDANNKEVMDYSKYRTTEGAMEYVDTNGNQSQNIENNNRKNLTELQKQQNKVLLENGQYFKYKVRVENHNISAPVYVRLQAEVEGSCDPKRISWKDSLGQERMLS